MGFGTDGVVLLLRTEDAGRRLLHLESAKNCRIRNGGNSRDLFISHRPAPGSVGSRGFAMTGALMGDGQREGDGRAASDF
jgi:hypothetical protein